MHCLLCHQKIARLRAWRTKSEFCSDECSDRYKKQTLERLLTDQNTSSADAVPLPLDEPSPEDLEPAVRESDDPPPPAAGAAVDGAVATSLFGDEEAGEDELWRLAGEVGGLPEGFEDGENSAASQEHAADTQGPDDALAALRDIAAKADTRPEGPDELALAAESPPEPDLSSDVDLLDESELEQATQPAVQQVQGESSILDRLVEESDWNVERQAEGDTAPAVESVEIQQALDESLRSREPEPAAVDTAAADSGDVKAEEPELAPTEDDFVESMLAAVEAVGDSGPEKVVPFPEAAKNGNHGKLAVEGIAEQLEASEQAAGERSREVPLKTDKARKAPKLRPAMVMAGLFPAAGAVTDVTASNWKEIAARASAWSPLEAFEVGAPLLNGLGAKPIGLEKTFRPHKGLVLNPAAHFLDTDVLLQVPKGPTEPLTPGALMLWPGVGRDFSPAAAELPSRLADLPYAPTPEAITPQGESVAPAGVNLPAGPLEPSAAFYESVSEEPLGPPGDEERDWFTDIEGFESL